MPKELWDHQDELLAGLISPVTRQPDRGSGPLDHPEGPWKLVNEKDGMYLERTAALIKSAMLPPEVSSALNQLLADVKLNRCDLGSIKAELQKRKADLTCMLSKVAEDSSQDKEHVHEQEDPTIQKILDGLEEIEDQLGFEESDTDEQLEEKEHKDPLDLILNEIDEISEGLVPDEDEEEGPADSELQEMVEGKVSAKEEDEESGVTVLPDGSGFFTSTVGSRATDDIARALEKATPEIKQFLMLRKPFSAVLDWTDQKGIVATPTDDGKWYVCDVARYSEPSEQTDQEVLDQVKQVAEFLYDDRYEGNDVEVQALSEDQVEDYFGDMKKGGLTGFGSKQAADGGKRPHPVSTMPATQPSESAEDAGNEQEFQTIMARVKSGLNPATLTPEALEKLRSQVRKAYQLKDKMHLLEPGMRTKVMQLLDLSAHPLLSPARVTVQGAKTKKWWKKAPTEERAKALQSAGIQKSPDSKWKDFEDAERDALKTLHKDKERKTEPVQPKTATLNPYITNFLSELETNLRAHAAERKALVQEINRALSESDTLSSKLEC